MIQFGFGLRDGRLNERCNGCLKKNKEMQDWCDRYHENPNYCVARCIQEHPDCPRDHPEIKKFIQEQLTGKTRQTYLPGCHCKTRCVLFMDGFLRCAECFAAYGTGASYNYSDSYVNDQITVAPNSDFAQKLKDSTTGEEADEIEIILTRRLTDNNRFHAQVKDHPEIWAAGNTWFSAIGDVVISHQEVFNKKILKIVAPPETVQS